MYRPLAYAFVLLFVAACATTDKSDERARTEGCLGGAGIGAGLGFAVAKLLGADDSTAAMAAALGAAGGAVAGCSYADNLIERRNELKGKENDLDARIQYAQNLNTDTRNYNEQLVKTIAKLEPKVDKLAMQVKQNQVTQKELEENRKALNNEVQVAEKGLNVAQQELTDLKNFRKTQGETPELDAEIKKLEQNVAQLRQNTTELASLSQRI